MSTTGFFAVSRKTFASAIDLGVNAAAALLVLARGSAADNSSTNWSAEAVSDRLGMRWSSGKAAIQQLITAKLVTVVRASTRPSYRIGGKAPLIWLPNSIIDGLAGEQPPIAKLRQTNDPMILRLFVELYVEQNLREDGGISPDLVYKTYSRSKVGSYAQYDVWRFHEPSMWVFWSSPTTKIHWHKMTDEEEKRGWNAAHYFFERWSAIETLGYIDWVPYLFEWDKGEPIHAVYSDSVIDIERQLAIACEAAAERCLTEGQLEVAQDRGGILVPVPRHIKDVAMKSVARLRYRPHTSLTAAWWANHDTKCREFSAGYNAIAVPRSAGLGSGAA